jgi:integrase
MSAGAVIAIIIVIAASGVLMMRFRKRWFAKISTAIRASEACGLKRRDIIWDKNQIKIERRWTAACIDKPKTKASKAPVALSPQLACFCVNGAASRLMRRTRIGFFPRSRCMGKSPCARESSLPINPRPAALAAGIRIGDGQRFGLHSLRSSMATWMVSIDKTDVKTAQGNMGHAGPEIMLRKYAQVVTPEMQGVQVRWFESCGLGVGQNLLAENAGSDAIQRNQKEFLVSAAGFEPATHALKGHCSTT